MPRAWAALVAAGLLLATTTAAADSSVHEVRERRVSLRRAQLAEVARAALPAVVSITTQEKPDAAGEPQKGIGSGFIVSPDGYIVTAAHVIEDTKRITVTLLDPHGWTEEVPGRVAGIDPETDTALLKVDVPRRLPTLKLGSARRVEVADWVVVIGSPYGLTHSVSVGVISAKGRNDIVPGERPGFVDFLQTDAAINPGNSGGPVLDVDGKVIGIANAVNTTGHGIGFAIPAEVARSVLEELRLHGQVRRGWLGVSVIDLTPELARSLGMGSYSGVIVSEVVAGSPAQRAGLREGDVIMGVNRERVQRAQALRWKVAQAGLGTPVRLHVARGGHASWVLVTPEEIPRVSSIPRKETGKQAAGSSGTGGSGAE
jgi:serine protease Do